MYETVARFVAPLAFSAALRIFRWSSISRASAWSSRASLNISSMRFVLVVRAPSEELRNQTLYPEGYRIHVQQGHGSFAFDPSIMSRHQAYRGSR